MGGGVGLGMRATTVYLNRPAALSPTGKRERVLGLFNPGIKTQILFQGFTVDNNFAGAQGVVTHAGNSALALADSKRVRLARG